MSVGNRQWAVGQLVNDGKRRMIIAGNDNSIYAGCLVYVDEYKHVGTMSVRFYQSYTVLIIEETGLQYNYANQEQLKRDVELFVPYFKDAPEP